MTTSIRKLIRALLFLALTIMIGVFGFILIEDYKPLDALYMTVITMSTVGYHEVVPLTDPGKVFAIFLIISTIGSFFYVVTLVATIVVEGEFRQIYKSYIVNKEIAALRNHVIICGLGRNGMETAKEFFAEKIPFIVIEKNQNSIDEFSQTHPLLALQGDARDEKVLKDANISFAKAVITSLPDDAANVFVTLTARELNPTVSIVSLAANESSISKLKTAGCDHVVLPNLMGGQRLAKIVTQPALMDFVDTITGQGESRFNLEYVTCYANSHLPGKTIAELQVKQRTGVLILGYKDERGQISVNIPANYVLKENEILFILGTQDQLSSFHKEYRTIV